MRHREHSTCRPQQRHTIEELKQSLAIYKLRDNMLHTLGSVGQVEMPAADAGCPPQFPHPLWLPAGHSLPLLLLLFFLGVLGSPEDTRGKSTGPHLYRHYEDALQNGPTTKLRSRASPSI